MSGWVTACVLVAALQPCGAMHVMRAPGTVSNFRDLGFTPCADGRVLKPGVLLRSATPANISEADADYVLSQIRTVLDLRSASDAMKDVGPRRLAATTQHVSVLTEQVLRSALLRKSIRTQPLDFAEIVTIGLAKKAVPSRRLARRLSLAMDARLARLMNDVGLSEVYWLMLRDRPDAIRRALELCAQQGSDPVLIHCTHGKDRTGVVVALLLHACGVAEDEIVADYAASHEWGCSTESQWAMLQAFPERVRGHIEEDTLVEWCMAPEEAMVALFRRVKEEHGSLDRYLDSIGVDSALRERLADRYTQPHS